MSTLQSRFFKYVEPPANSNACWFWTGMHTEFGYGKIYEGGPRGRQLYAHRVSWEIHHGKPFPEGMVARHSCDNADCVNPEHITPGSAKQNSDDMISRNRNPILIKRSQCARGHDLTQPENMRFDSGQRRGCLVCRKLSYAKRSKTHGAQKGC